VQQQLFDPWAVDRDQDAARRRHRITPAQAEQLVIDLVTRAGGRVSGDRLLRAGLDAGLDSEAVSHAVHVLQRSRRLTSDGSTISLVAA
jgi:predicted HD phosphohydrolase